MERIEGYKAKNVGWCRFREGPTVHSDENSFVLWAVKGGTRGFKQRSEMNRLGYLIFPFVFTQHNEEAKATLPWFEE